VRIEAIVPPDVADDILAYLRREILPEHHVTAFVETVEAVRAEQFVRIERPSADLRSHTRRKTAAAGRS
jgi:hypothetical protein